MSISQLNGTERLRATMAVAALRSNAASASSPSVTRQADAVSLSGPARSVAAALKTVADASDVREDRVAALKAAIANGSYAVNSRQLAGAMAKSSLTS